MTPNPSLNAATILAIETCTSACSVALWANNTLSFQLIDTPRGHSQALIPMIEALLAEAQLTVNDLDYVAISQGPGAFTGIRIGAGVAKGIAYGQNIPIIPICSLSILAQAVFTDTAAEHVSVMLDARMGEIYAAQFKRRTAAINTHIDTHINGNFDTNRNSAATEITPDFIITTPAQVCRLDAGTNGDTPNHETPTDESLAGKEGLAGKSVTRISENTVSGNTISEKTISGHTIAGTALLEYAEVIAANGGIPCSIIYPHAKDLVLLAKTGRYPTVSAAEFSPVYLRNNVTY
ncbi:tRNA (adenosine(37)-N6)-threonylcarbamoyltransferase complex dimerization subunit type 1 TsaB [Ostreibacterium oceani]|nr:tRNA (adenosine(37)-N6)-threonylcarbamoyltransferase complex dimerization subunit type 1 TsaB [Ostreibacterium oceani]